MTAPPANDAFLRHPMMTARPPMTAPNAIRIVPTIRQ